MPIFSKNKTTLNQKTTQKQVNLSQAINRGLQRANASYHENMQQDQKKTLSNADKQYIYENEMLTHKGIRKKAFNLFREWHTVDNPLDGKDVPPETEKAINNFRKQVNLPKKFMQDYINKSVIGRGYFELTTLELIEENGLGLEKPLPLGLSDVVNVDPRSIEPNTVKNEKANDINNFQTPLLDVDYYVQKQGRGKPKLLLHPSRIIETHEFTLGDSNPVGVIDVAYRIANSKMNADWAFGEIPYRFGKPFLVCNITGGTQDEIEEVFGALGKLNPKTGFAGDDRYVFKILNPQQIDPKEFAQYYYVNLAAALEMPLLMLIGETHGAVAGSVSDRADYYKDLECIQNIVYTPIINRIYSQLLGSWDYDIKWNPIYVDEKSQAEIAKTWMEAFKIIYSDMGLVDDVTMRQMCREKDINIPEEFELPVEEPVVDIPVYEIEPPVEKAKIREPTMEELAFAEKMRDIGEKELVEQEKRLKQKHKGKK